MVEMFSVNKFMNNDVINQVPRQLHEIGIEYNLTVLAAASPS